jgi:hypothetical protein
MSLGIVQIPSSFHRPKAGNGEDDDLVAAYLPHFGWKKAGGAKYLRAKYRNTADNDRRQIQAAERSRGNRTSYMESWRAARSIRALNAVEEAPAENSTHAIMGMDEMRRARVPLKEMLRRQESLWHQGSRLWRAPIRPGSFLRPRRMAGCPYQRRTNS